MRWNSPWSVGFPGWHLECSVMSTRYLGKTFDIHGGGSDLKFPHHENEVAQNYGACKCAPARYWMHGNMLLMNGRKMSKSDGNTITPEELFTGNSKHISKAYSPMVVRFFMLQSHYTSTLDISDEALAAAEKGYRRLMEAYNTLNDIQHPGNGSAGEPDTALNQLMDMAFAEMDDDFNTPKALARLFEIVTKINSLKGGQLSMQEVTSETLDRLRQIFKSFIFDILGLQEENAASDNNGYMDGLMDLIINIRQEARSKKDWATSDLIRDKLKEIDIQIKDEKNGTNWMIG